MRVLIILVQILISLFLTASLMPVVLVSLPAAQEEGVGMGIMGVMVVVAFIVVALVWPKRRRKP